MSSAGVVVAAPQSYFCYQCNRTVTFTPIPNSDLSCPNCSGGFLEEYDSNPQFPQNPTFNSDNPFASATIFPDPFSLFSDPGFSQGPVVFTRTTIDLQNPRNFSPFLSPNSSAASGFNPFDFLQNYLQNLQERGANVQFVVENHSGGPNFQLPQNFGDYFLGPGLEQLIQQLAENDPNRYGTPPASKRAIDGLPNVVITAEIVNSESNSCAVCMNEFEVGLDAKQMPCKHLYHSDCLLPWLQLHNSCPVCRYELPTDDPDYENRRANGGQGGSNEGSSGNGEEGPQSGRGGSRGFRISQPWPFRVFGGSGGDNDGGNSGAGGGGGRSGGSRGFRIPQPWPFFGGFGGDNDGGNSGGGGGGGRSGDHGSETNMESLD